MNLANRLTLSRIIMAFFFMAALLYRGLPYGHVVATGIFLLAWITDILDGAIARRLGQVTNFGKLIDPLSDKILMSAAFIAFVQIPEIGIPAWMVVVIISREFIITGMRLLAASRGKVISAGKWGKHKTTSQMLTVVIFLIALSIQQIAPEFWRAHLYTIGNHSLSLDGIFQTLKYIVLYITVALTIMSGLLYLKEHKEILLSEP